MVKPDAQTGLAVMEPDDARRGFALPAAIGAIVIVGVLVTAGFYMAQQEMRIGVATENSGMAFYVAEHAASEVLDNWDNSVMEAQALFDPTTFTGTVDEGTWTVDVRRVGTRMYFLDATGTITEGGALYAGATRRIGLLARHLELGIEPPAALTTMGAFMLSGLPPEVIGTDENPTPPDANWGSVCPVASSDSPGFLSDDITGVPDAPGMMGTAGCGSYITGSSPECVDDDATVDDTFEPFYDATYWEYLIDIADHELPPGNYSTTPSTSGGACNRDDVNNWGEPDDQSDPCGTYFPLIYISGDAVWNGARGQGILLVDGDLSIGGTGKYYGIIVVLGTVSTTGNPEIHGGLIAESMQTLGGTPVIQYSSCAVDRAINLNSNVARARPLIQRGFVDLTNLTN